jgi:hypothetical protein
VVHEVALHAAVGEPAVMVRQRAHLLALADLPYVQLRIIPGLAHTTACTTDLDTFVECGRVEPSSVRWQGGRVVA